MKKRLNSIKLRTKWPLRRHLVRILGLFVAQILGLDWLNTSFLFSFSIYSISEVILYVLRNKNILIYAFKDKVILSLRRNDFLFFVLFFKYSLVFNHFIDYKINDFIFILHINSEQIKVKTNEYKRIVWFYDSFKTDFICKIYNKMNKRLCIQNQWFFLFWITCITNTS